MRIVIAGAPGSGKTTLAKRLAESLGIPHIEADQIFWKPGRFDEELKAKLSQSSAWIFEGHLLKAAPLVFPHTDVLLLIEGQEFESLLAALKRDFRERKFRKFFFYLIHHQKIAARRSRLLQSYRGKLIRLSRGVSLPEVLVHL